MPFVGAMATTDVDVDYKGDFQLLMREDTNVGQKIFHIMYTTVAFLIVSTSAAQTLTSNQNVWDCV